MCYISIIFEGFLFEITYQKQIVHKKMPLFYGPFTTSQSCSISWNPILTGNAMMVTVFMNWGDRQPWLKDTINHRLSKKQLITKDGDRFKVVIIKQCIETCSDVLNLATLVTVNLNFLSFPFCCIYASLLENNHIVCCLYVGFRGDLVYKTEQPCGMPVGLLPFASDQSFKYWKFIEACMSFWTGSPITIVEEAGNHRNILYCPSVSLLDSWVEIGSSWRKLITICRRILEGKS